MIILLILLPFTLFSEILENQNIDCLLEHADPETLVICDIDNTLIESTLQMGSAQWRNHIRRKAKKLGCTEKTAEEILDKFWLFAQYFVPVRSVDPAAPAVLMQLQEMRIPVIALTAREPIEALHTAKQLESANFDLIHSHPFEDTFLPLPHPSIFEKGIIYCGDNTKEAALEAFFQKMGSIPKRVLFIDDRLEQIKSVESFAKRIGIIFVGIRFGGADARVKAFNPEVADYQWSHLPDIISDEEAFIQNSLKNREFDKEAL